MGLSTRLAKSTPPQIPSHAIHPNSRHLFGIHQHREFYSVQDFKTDLEPPLNSFYKHASKPHSIYPIRRLSFRVLNSVRCCRRSKRFPVGYRRGSPSDAAGNELYHMHESFLVEQPRAPSDYRPTYMYNAARAEPPSDAAWAFPVEWIRLTNALKSVRAFLVFTSFKSHTWRGSPCWHHGPSLTISDFKKGVLRDYILCVLLFCIHVIWL